jgi:hypothetical protein
VTIYNPIEHVRCMRGDGHEFTPNQKWPVGGSHRYDCERCGRSQFAIGTAMVLLFVLLPFLVLWLRLREAYRRLRWGQEVNSS